jgi:DNA-binding transcriptional ArsR family regulator
MVERAGRLTTQNPSSSRPARGADPGPSRSTLNAAILTAQIPDWLFQSFHYRGNMEIEAASSCLAALALPGRLQVFRMLVKAGVLGLPAGEIARALDVPPNSLSANLNVLANAGLVRSRRQGRSIIYTAQYDRMRNLLGFLVEDCCGGSPEICSPLAAVIQTAACRLKEPA